MRVAISDASYFPLFYLNHWHISFKRLFYFISVYDHNYDDKILTYAVHNDVKIGCFFLISPFSFEHDYSKFTN